MIRPIRKKLLCLALSLLLAAAVCGFSGCSSKPVPTETPAPTVPTLPTMPGGGTVLPPDVFDDDLPADVASEISEALEEVVQFTLEVTGKDGVTSSQTVSTDCKTVGDALMAYGMIDGEQDEYGLYVKTVLGETLDYEKDGLYWAFYADGNYAPYGVDTTEIVPGTVYGFRAEK